MPSAEWNEATWARDYDWSGGGEEWSAPFGSSEMQWFGSLLPRIHRYVPAPHVVEIAPGFGRWTRFLHGLCDRLTIVDISERCLAACRARFAGVSNITYVHNDGRSLDAIGDDSADFLFSYDSLVHVELDVLDAYIAQLRTKLRADGIAFIHHSNALEAAAQGCPPVYYLETGHHRAVTVSADTVVAAAQAHGLVCPTQEIIPLGSPADPHAPAYFLDCITTIAHRASRWDTGSQRLVNENFFREAETMRALAPLYGPAR